MAGYADSHWVYASVEEWYQTSIRLACVPSTPLDHTLAINHCDDIILFHVPPRVRAPFKEMDDSFNPFLYSPFRIIILYRDQFSRLMEQIFLLSFEPS